MSVPPDWRAVATAAVEGNWRSNSYMVGFLVSLAKQDDGGETVQFVAEEYERIKREAKA